MKTIRFHSQKGFAYISGIVYRSDPCLYAKRMGGHHLSAHIKHHTVALIRTEILRTIGVAFFLDTLYKHKMLDHIYEDVEYGL